MYAEMTGSLPVVVRTTSFGACSFGRRKVGSCSDDSCATEQCDDLPHTFSDKNKGDALKTV